MLKPDGAVAAVARDIGMPRESVPRTRALSEWVLRRSAAADREAVWESVRRLEATTGKPASWMIDGNQSHEPLLASTSGKRLDLGALHRAWLAIPEEDRPPHPLAPLLRAFMADTGRADR